MLLRKLCQKDENACKKNKDCNWYKIQINCVIFIHLHNISNLVFKFKFEYQSKLVIFLKGLWTFL